MDFVHPQHVTGHCPSHFDSRVRFPFLEPSAISESDARNAGAAARQRVREGTGGMKAVSDVDVAGIRGH